MTWRAVLACAAALAAGCGKKQPEGAADPAPAAPAPQAPEREGSSSGTRAPAQPRDRCRAAIDHALALSKIPDRDMLEKLAVMMAEACRSDGWSGELLACLEGAKDATALETCRPTASQQESLGARMASMIGADAGISIGSAPRPDAAPGAPAPGPLEARLHDHARLLAFDVSLFQLVEAYPGAAKGTTFETGEYRWVRHAWPPLEAIRKQLDAVLAPTSAGPSLAADPAVRAYAEKAAGWMPRLIALVAYYDGMKFVDDEFDRGRREAGDVRRTAAELARLRGPMRRAVFEAWRERVAPYRESPRALAAHAWMACMSIADRVMENAKLDAVTRAVSECRRSIPRLAESGSASGFDAEVRNAASELGDWVAQGYPSWRTDVSHALGGLTLRFLELWPTLPAAPAEKPAP